jgi:type IV secretion system protein TrbE
MIRVGTIARDYLESGAMSSLIGLYGFVDEHTFLTKSGDLGVVVRVPGVDAECLDHPERDHIARRFGSAIRTFDERFRIYQYLLKRDNAAIPHRHYDNPIVEQAISNRIEFLAAKSESLYTIDIFFVLMYEGWHRASGSGAKIRALVNRPQSAVREMLSADRTFMLFEDDLARASELLGNKAASLVIQLQDTLGVELLDKADAFQFFRRLLNFSSYKLESRIKYDLHLDYFTCDSSLECHRDHLRLDNYFVQVVSLKEPPAQTFANVLQALQEISANFIIATEWKRESNLAARKEINSKRRHFHNSKASLTNYMSDAPLNPQEMLIDDGAAALVADLGGCLREIEINGNHFGKFSLVIVLYDLDRAKLRRAVAECFKIFSTHDALLTEERYNLLNAFLSIVPGNRNFNLRHMWLLNTNYADLSFLF